MITFTISAPIKLLSLNSAFATLRGGRRVRSERYKEFAKELSKIMKDKAEEFKLFNEAYSPTENEIHAHLVFNTPDLYTKDGRISKKSSDLGNLEKCLTDSVLTGLIDDAEIVMWILRKKYAPSYSFTLQLKIMPRDQ